MTWEHLTKDDIADIDRDIATLQTAFYREIETGSAIDSARILGEMERLREIKKDRLKSYWHQEVENEAFKKQ